MIAKKDRNLNISVGYGLEGALTDAVSNQIIRDVIVPNFKGNDYYRGIELGTDAIIDAIQGTYKAKPKKDAPGGGIAILIIVAIIIILISAGGGGKGGQFMSRRGSKGIDPHLLEILLRSAAGRNRGSFGGGFGGSRGGGGFGGFGGGSFGGGGASGSW